MGQLALPQDLVIVLIDRSSRKPLYTLPPPSLHFNLNPEQLFEGIRRTRQQFKTPRYFGKMQKRHLHYLWHGFATDILLQTRTVGGRYVHGRQSSRQLVTGQAMSAVSNRKKHILAVHLNPLLEQEGS